MTKTSRTAFLWFRSDNRKPVVSSVEPSAIQNPKWLGLSVVAFLLAVSGAVAQAEQPANVPRIGFLIGSSPSANAARIEAFRVCASLDTWKAKTLSLNSGRRKENSIGCLSLRPK